VKPSERLAEIEKYYEERINPNHPKKNVTWLIARIKKLEAQLRSMPNIMYLELLETTAWMGIPENKREACIKQQVSNIQFIVDKTLEGDDE